MTEVDLSVVPAIPQVDLAVDKSLVEDDYRAASNKLLKERDIEGATVALKNAPRELSCKSICR